MLRINNINWLWCPYMSFDHLSKSSRDRPTYNNRAYRYCRDCVKTVIGVELKRFTFELPRHFVLQPSASKSRLLLLLVLLLLSSSCLLTAVVRAKMGTCTILLAFQMNKDVKTEDVFPLIPQLLKMVMDDVTVLYPSNGTKSIDGLVVASGNNKKCQAIVRYHSNRLLTMDVQHECKSEEELTPMAPPYNLDSIRTMDRQIQIQLGDMCEKSVSLFVPIRRACQLPRNYAVLADDRLVETDYTHALCDVTSPYQRVCVLHSRQFGHVLTLDDDVMFGEFDDVYVNTVLGLDRNNSYGGTTVLILGGGDGGLLNRLVSLPQPPKHVRMAEIDEEVMKACRKYMRSACGHVMDNYKGDNYQIEVRDCVEVLKESSENGTQYDYVVNDLTEFSVEKNKYGFNYDFKTNNVVMELSFKCLKPGGKYLARGNCLSAGPYIEKIEQEFHDLGVPFKRYDRHVPSFREIYCFFEATNVRSKSTADKQ